MTGHILLMGGSGFIGQALCRRLAGDSRQVIIVSHTKPAYLAANAQWRQGSLDDAQLLHELLPGCDAVFHLASRTTPGASADAPVREATENLFPSLRLIETLLGYPGTRLTYLSSGGTIYGATPSMPVTENTPLHPKSFYGAGKVAVEAFLSVLATQGYPITVFRPSNIYGPGQPLRPGFGLIRTILEHIRQNTVMSVWGDGSTIRDYLYIDDLVEALYLSLSQPASGLYNVGCGQGYSINHIIALANEVTGSPLSVNYVSSRKVDVPAIVLDISSIRSQYHWEPGTAIRDGIEKTWHWLKNQH